MDITLAWLITPLFIMGLVFFIFAVFALVQALMATPRAGWGDFFSWLMVSCLAFIAAATLSLASGVSAWPFKLQRRLQ